MSVNLRIHLVLPVYNESEVIEKVVRENCEFVSKLPNGKLIITEDGSTDGTKQILYNLKEKLKFDLYASEKRKGAARAQRDALKIAMKNADIILISDSDGQHDPNDFSGLLKKIPKFDMVVGYKNERKDPFLRILGSKIWNFYIRLLFGLNIHDVNCGFRAMKSEVLHHILKHSETFPECVLTELAIRAHNAGFKITEGKISHHWRRDNPKAWNPLKIPMIVWKLFLVSTRLKKEFLLKRMP